MLIDLINQHASQAAQAGDFAGVAATLNSLRTSVSDTTHWSFGLMMTQGQLPADLVAGIAAAVRSAGAANPLMDSAFIAFSTTGLELHTAERQVMIDTIGAGLPPEAIAAVKSLGVRSVPTVVTTEDECRRAWIVYSCLAPIQESQAAAATKLNNAEASLGPEHTDGLSLEELQERCDAITASVTGEV
jgi:hypothetical protein